MRFLLLLSLLLACCATAFEVYPFDAPVMNCQQPVWTDCSSGSDSTGTGTFAAPYLTIANTIAQTPVSDNICVFIKNGPCGESQVVVSPYYSFFGYGNAPVQITHGFSYTAGSFDGSVVGFYNLKIGTLTLDTTADSSVTVQVFNSVVQAGTVNGNLGGYTVVFRNSPVTLSTLAGSVSFYDCDISIGALSAGSLGAGTLVSVVRGVYTSSTTMGDYSIIRFMNTDVRSTSFSGTGTGAALPLLMLGDSCDGTPSLSGVQQFNFHDIQDVRIYRGTGTIGAGGTVTVSLPTWFYSDRYSIHLTPTSATAINNWISSQGSGSFTVSGQAAATFNWLAELN